ncbi:MAG: acyl-CoA dehydrogenase family protein [Planctomycetes bacterium]|nr:acyl-CoA dehydrogenase family protein [Planctomycetota bacterium]
MFDFEPTVDERAVADRARKFAMEVLEPQARAADAGRRFDREVVRALGREGLLGGPIAKNLGGEGLGHRAQALVYEELGRVDTSVRGFVAVQTGLVASCIQDWGSAQQKSTWLPDLCQAQVIGCYGLTEPGAGSDVASMTSRARKDGDDWIIEGQKVWITNGSVADLALLFVQADPEAKHRGITCFLVPTKTAGFERERMTAPELGHRAADHARFRFQGLRVPDAARMGEVGQGFKIAMAALDHGRLGVAAGAVGLHQACLDASLDFVRSRRQFGSRLGDFQMIQRTITDMHCSLEAARLLTWQAATMKDRGEKATLAVSRAKLFATEAAAEAAHQAVLLHGGRGYNNDYPVERFFRDIVGLEIYEGSSNIQRIIIARELIGKDDGAELHDL